MFWLIIVSVLIQQSCLKELLPKQSSAIQDFLVCQVCLRTKLCKGSGILQEKDLHKPQITITDYLQKDTSKPRHHHSGIHFKYISPAKILLHISGPVSSWGCKGALLQASLCEVNRQNSRRKRETTASCPLTTAQLIHMHHGLCTHMCTCADTPVEMREMILGVHLALHFVWGKCLGYRTSKLGAVPAGGWT